MHAQFVTASLSLLFAITVNVGGDEGNDVSANREVVPVSPEPQHQGSLPQMLEFCWSAGPPMPQGMQDNHTAIVHNWLVSVGGFCGGHDSDWKPGVYPRGFLNAVWGVDITREAQGWVELPSLPGAARQGMQGTRLGNALYVWGGFSYTDPYAYSDGYRLSRDNGKWKWDELPSLPSPSAWAGACTFGFKIHCFGGCDYDAERFYTLRNRTGQIKRLGARHIVIDTHNLGAGWQEAHPCPGTPRCLTAAAEVDGQLYVVGGVGVAQSGSYCNVVDAWRYDPLSEVWHRLRYLPISAAGSSPGYIVYKNRYILLPCGYQYDSIMKPDGALAASYGQPNTVKRTWSNHPRFKDTHYFNHCYVYDTQTNLYGTATNLPFDDVATIIAIHGDTVYMLPGETAGFRWDGEYFGHHPEFVLKGKMKELNWE